MDRERERDKEKDKREKEKRERERENKKHLPRLCGAARRSCFNLNVKTIQ